MFNSILQNPVFQEIFKTKVIKVVAPASGMDPQKLNDLRTLPDLTIEIPPSLIADDIVYHANSDEVRFNILKNALLDPSENTIVWTLRGGYGSARLLDQMRALPIPKKQKIFIGFSDNTALHLFLTQKWHWNTIHASGLAQILDAGQDPQNYMKIAEIIAQKIPVQAFNHLQPLNAAAKAADKIQGRLTGGNLTVLESGIGTHWQAKTAKKILFLEDTGEKGYRIDRSLYHLRQAGLIKNVKAVVFGEFSDENKDPTITTALQRFAKDVSIPVYQTDQFGHGKINYPLVYNAKAEIAASSSEGYTMKMKITTYRG